jgi:cobalt/nickel transport system permease protein
MESRCYDGEIRVLSGEYEKNKSNFRKIAVFEAVLILLAVWGRIV